MRVAVINLSGAVHLRRRALAVRARSTRSSSGSMARPTPSSSTSTPRSPARRWRWAGTSTAGSPRSFGTHTHVPTADGRVLPGGTAFITDVGMTGSRAGVLGVTARAGARALRHPDAGPLRDRRGGRLGERGRGRDRRRRPRPSIEQVLEPAARLSAVVAGAADERQGDEHERQEPGDVEVEPVVDGELRSRSGARRRGRRPEPGSGGAARRRRATASRTTARLHPRGERAGPGPGPRPRRGVPVRLEADRPPVEGRQPGIDQRPGRAPAR